ncbi:uncharacterized protein BP5553_00857 [Venustampulla echinocandica]|uniref:Uncharacterized protein n=1 Tax=Venustampulla echinocandica TaxID=2656787 RepID=A0A370TZF9_9HELO|nr:uncharacterized protein BP5553_00857 [Venustampulla echinocandica]RDL40878.1 hypothetical protein BP5553_00857 [Venustampulla echinocandica]
MHTSVVWCGVVAITIALVRAGEIAPINTSLEMEVEREFAAIYPRASLTNFQIFTGSLGNAAAEPITASGEEGRPFSVNGETFNQLQDAAKRSCSSQKTACAAIANGPGGGGGGGGKNTPPGAVTVNACDQQNTACVAATKGMADMALKSQEGGNLIFCDS